MSRKKLTSAQKTQIILALIGVVSATIVALFGSPVIERFFPPSTSTPTITLPPSITSTSVPSLTPTPTLTSTPTFPALEPTLLTREPGGITSQVMVLEAESADVFTDVPFRPNAYGGKTVHLDSVDIDADDTDLEKEIVFVVEIEKESAYILYIRHSNANDPNKSSEILNVYLGEAELNKFLTANTGDWNVFAQPPIGEIFLTEGKHSIKLVVTKGDGYGIDIDAIILIPK